MGSLPRPHRVGQGPALPAGLASDLLAELEDHVACQGEATGAVVTTPARACRSIHLDAAYAAMAAAYPLEQGRAALSELHRANQLGLGMLVLGSCAAVAADRLGPHAPGIGWLLQGLVWGIVATGLAWMLHGAFQRGMGSLLAALLQLSAGSWVLLLATAAATPAVAKIPQLAPHAPTWIDGRWISVGVVMVLIVLLSILRQRAIPLAVGLAVAGVVLHPGAPITGTRYVWREPHAGGEAMALSTSQHPDRVRLNLDGEGLRVETIVPATVWLHRNEGRQRDIGEALLDKQAGQPPSGQLLGRTSVMLPAIPWAGSAWGMLAILFPLLLATATICLAAQFRRQPADDWRLSLCMVTLVLLATVYLCPLSTPDLITVPGVESYSKGLRALLTMPVWQALLAAAWLMPLASVVVASRRASRHSFLSAESSLQSGT